MSAGDGRRPPLLLCFHHAGAGVSAFARWQARFGTAAEVVPVLLPGRDARAREPRITERAALLAELEVAAAVTEGRPYALYGHSLGGLVAYSFAAAREAAGAPPLAVAIGAVLPPHLRSPLAHSAELPDEPLLRLLVRQGVLPPSAADDELNGGLFRRRVLPRLRDDLRLARDLIGRAGTPLRTPVLALAGRDDPVAPPAGVAQWERFAAGGFRLRLVEGGHLFVRDKALPDLLRRELERLPATTSRAGVQGTRARSSERQAPAA
ncbi:thioesterase II family protein [Streptomyces sp. CA-249302]|uniref:thioesterase II family protein n=1 Tax=Streptomyces sp. CA-249302 TaxID=3240058 RepID=UPI003D91215B